MEPEIDESEDRAAKRLKHSPSEVIDLSENDYLPSAEAPSSSCESSAAAPAVNCTGPSSSTTNTAGIGTATQLDYPPTSAAHTSTPAAITDSQLVVTLIDPSEQVPQTPSTKHTPLSFVQAADPAATVELPQLKQMVVPELAEDSRMIALQKANQGLLTASPAQAASSSRRTACMSAEPTAVLPPAGTNPSEAELVDLMPAYLQCTPVTVAMCSRMADFARAKQEQQLQQRSTQAGSSSTGVQPHGQQASSSASTPDTCNIPVFSRRQFIWVSAAGGLGVTWAVWCVAAVLLVVQQVFRCLDCYSLIDSYRNKPCWLLLLLLLPGT